MKIIPFIITLFALLLISCTSKTAEEHEHQEGNLEPLAYTVYTNKHELFVEFKPLIIGSTSKFAAHFTILGKTFLPLTEGKVTVSLIVGEKGIRNSTEKASSPGIFRLALKPINAGKGKLIFDIETKEYTDQIIIENIMVYPDEKTAFKNLQENLSASKANNIGEETDKGGSRTPNENMQMGEQIIYLKEQAWKIEFANKIVKKQNFTEIIKTTGQILPAQGDEVIITAKSSGIVTFWNTKKLVGSSVKKGETLFIISGSDLIDNNLDTKYKEAKAVYEKNKTDFEKAKELIKDTIISQKEFREIQLRFKNVQITFTNIANSYTTGGQKIVSPIKGYVKNLLVSEGQYVKIGQSIASVSQNQKLILKAEVSQKHFSKLHSISSANFKMAYSTKMYSTDSLNGKLISFGKSTSNNAYYIPVNFEIDNQGEIIPGAFIEVFLKTNVLKDVLVIPYAALIEEQGNYYAYIQTSGEGFQKRELKLGADDGKYVQVLSGIKENERVVIKGAYQIKLATMSGKIPEHGHEH